MGNESILLVSGVGEAILFSNAIFNLIEILASMDHGHDHWKTSEYFYGVLQ